MPSVPPEIRAHQAWLRLVRPTGLVVAAPALVRAGAILNQRDIEGQERLRAFLAGDATAGSPASAFLDFAAAVLDWPDASPKVFRSENATPVPKELVVELPDTGEVLRPDAAIRDPDSLPKPSPLEGLSLPGAPQGASDGPPDPVAPRWQLLVLAFGPHTALDQPLPGSDISPHGSMERLLRETGVPAGIVWGAGRLRLVSAPRGESSGHLDFVLADLAETAGRPMVGALRLLLGVPRLFSLPRAKRLPSLLRESRLYQNEVSEKLAGQVLEGLYDLLRGVQAADTAWQGRLLGETLREAPDQIYRGLLAVILRLVFLLYAEQRGLLPDDPTFVRHYSLTRLFERLRDDAALHPDTMDQRRGAWAHLLTLFRMVFNGVRSGKMQLPARRGALFDPNEWPFLEGRPLAGGRQTHLRIEAPPISDATVLGMLRRLLILDGERISYRALDVEQIGSVYETMMGFRLEHATGPSLAVKSPKKFGAPSVVDLEEILATPAAKRGKRIQEETDRKLTDRVVAAVRAAGTVDELHAALHSVVDRSATPDVVPPGSLVLQPSDERRRSGSHYTPRSLTAPIVRRALEPQLARLRERDAGAARPADILDLKVCDPAMGSGAFLVESCRQLGDELIAGWKAHGDRPEIPAEEDEVVFARRLVARRCLYGVDRNPVAVDLAKLSLWLVTLAKDLPLTFLDHALRAGDSLVGLSRKQVERLDWTARRADDRAGTKSDQYIFSVRRVEESVSRADALRRTIRDAGDEAADSTRRELWNNSRDALSEIRLFGDVVVATFFDEAKPAARERERRGRATDMLRGHAEDHRGWIETLRAGERPLAPFHWEIEFPEVFRREKPGFDVFVGNPPFAGKNTVIAGNPQHYLDWLKEAHPESHGNADLVAHFFRRAFGLLRENGTLGLIATNTIAQGDTRATGLRWIAENGGTIYDAIRRYRWPGQAAVVVSVIHLAKGDPPPSRLDGREVERITAFLFDQGGNNDPAPLAANAHQSFVGSYLLGMGFTFDDTDPKRVASSLADRERLIRQDPRNTERIRPYMGGKELNKSPTHAHHRYAIDFEDFPLRREDLGKPWSAASGNRRRDWLREGIVPLDYPGPVAADWPELLAIADARVKPDRAHLTTNAIGRKRAQFWWRYGSTAKELYVATAGLDRVLAVSRIGQHAAFAFLPPGMVYAESLIVFPFASFAAFCALQARPHEAWTRFLGSSMKDDLRYTPSDCFETFPFPDGWRDRTDLEAAGQAYHDHRAALMAANHQGLTTTLNRFHDPDEDDPGIQRLRDLHAAMDRAVLAAYDWGDLPTDCEFLPDHQDDPNSRIRYRWPDAVQNDVLARLLALNATRAAAEAGTASARTTAHGRSALSEAEKAARRRAQQRGYARQRRAKQEARRKETLEKILARMEDGT